MEKRKEEAGHASLLPATAADGTGVRAEIEGEGEQVILILHPGMDIGQSYAQIAAQLSKRYRVIRPHRRQYRLDLKTDPLRGSPCTVAEEVEHVLAIVRTLEAPIFLFGHSSGGTIALETLAASPASFAGGMIYEPAAVIQRADGFCLAEDRIEHDGETGEGLKRSRQALIAGHPGAALGIFTQIAAGWPGFPAYLAGSLTALFPTYRKLIPCQIDDLEALERLGLRIETYSRLNLPIALVGGERSPDALKAIVSAVANVLPETERITLSKQGHGAHVRDPKQLATVIETFASKVFEKILPA